LPITFKPSSFSYLTSVTEGSSVSAVGVSTTTTGVIVSGVSLISVTGVLFSATGSFSFGFFFGAGAS